ncbi:unnamed protein product [Phytophthora fragariaefolia]|uniref:Unnamed protein product n=1 Tax=Phytophthora fragariaefolia TaxID=1490495 RepID=A0A9W6WIX0_9STRA|nr:unnamed protein product [Phytophthora fragariaefolia]
MWRIGSTEDDHREAITLTRTTLASMIVTSRPLTTLNAEPRRSRRMAGLRTAAVAETSLPEVSTATNRNQGLDPLNTTEIEKERNGTFGGGESDERRNDEWNGGSSEGLVASVTQKTTNPRMILLDTGANVSVISERLVKQLRLREVQDHGRCMEIQGFTKRTMATTKRALAKVTLGWNQVYKYELWVMDHGAEVDVVFGADFMIPAAVRLDLFHATARLPDEVEIPLIKTQRTADTREEGPHVPDGPTEVLTIPGHESRDYRPMQQPPTNVTHELWVRRTKELILKVVEFRRGRPRRVRVMNISDRLATCSVRIPLLLWVPREGLPRTEGYVRLGSDNRFIQDFAGYGAALYQAREEDFGPSGDLSTAKRSFAALQAKVADASILRHFDRTKEVHVMLFANDWALSTTLMQEHDGVMHPVRFYGRVLKDNEVNYHLAEKEVLALLLLLKTCYTQLAGPYNVTDLVVVGDSRLSIQQSLGVIACLKESLLTQLNIHRELVARFQSVRYLHVTREYNSSADSLAGETLAAKEAKTTLTEESKSKLEQLNRIHEVIYERPNREVTQASTLRTLSEDMVTQRGNLFDFALKPRIITAITRQQTQAAKKRVRFADTHDEDSEALPMEPKPPDRPNDATTESSHVENGEIFPGATERPPSAEDVDPLEVQEERPRRVGRAQDEELRWANLKLVLNGES